MTGFIVKYMGREFRIGVPGIGVHLVAHLVRNEFILMGAGILGSWQIRREGIEFEVEVAEFDEASEPMSEKNPSLVDPEYKKMIDTRDAEWEQNWKLQRFREMETILREEGLLPDMTGNI